MIVNANAFAEGVLVDGFDESSTARVKDAIIKGDSIADAVAAEKALIDEFTKKLKVDVIENSVHKYGGGQSGSGSVQSLVDRAFAKKGGK